MKSGSGAWRNDSGSLANLIIDLLSIRNASWAFQRPVGIMKGNAILQSLAQAPRWSSVEISERHVVRPTSDLIALGYRARGNRTGAEPYEALCTSSYRATAGGWKLFQHHQTPIPSVSAREQA